MTKRLPALLLTAAVGVIALTGCSSRAAGADLVGGDPGNRSPMLQHANALGDQSASGSAVVTPLSQSDFDDQRHDQTSCRSESRGPGSVTYCESLLVANDAVQWTVYLAVPQTPVTVHASVGNSDFDYSSTIKISDPYVKIVWDKPGIPVDISLSTTMLIDLNDAADTTYDANNYLASYEGTYYSEEDLVLE
jgi:hypothetical protein